MIESLFSTESNIDVCKIIIVFITVIAILCFHCFGKSGNSENLETKIELISRVLKVESN